MKSSLNCPICLSSNIKIIGFREEWLQNKKKALEVTYSDKLCGNCDFIFSDPNLNEEQLIDYYKNYFSSLSNLTDIEISIRLQYFKKFLDKNSKILEIGGGKGSFRKKLLESYAKVDNFDLSEGEVEFNNLYDCVCSFYLMEHLYNLNEWLDYNLLKLKYGGYFILEVPNFEKFPNASLNNEHLYHFKPRDMGNLLSKKGIKVISQNQISPSRFFGFVLVGIKEKSNNNFEILKGVKKSNELYKFQLLNENKINIKIKKLNKFVKKNEGVTGIIPCNTNTTKLIKSSYFKCLNQISLFDRDLEKEGLDWCNSSLSVNNNESKKINECTSFIITSRQYYEEIYNNLKALNKNLRIETFYGVD